MSIGKLANSEIFCINDTTFLSLRNNPVDANDVQDVRKILNSGTFFFSVVHQAGAPKFDLTLCAQKAQRTSVTDNRFFWNRMMYLHLKFFDINTEKWLTKIMCGSVLINTVYVGHQQAKACLISRLSNERAGTRFHVRGVNDDGAVANFVETEQVIFLEQKTISYILIRGSIPIFWEQTGVQVGAHRLKISREYEVSHPAFDRHLASIQHLYGKQVLISLVSYKDAEQVVGRMYKAHHKNSLFHDQIPYVAFDFHAQCPRGKGEDSLGPWKNDITKHYEEFGLFHADGQSVHSQQQGTFRINCIDCLDRTNRVQTVIGLEVGCSLFQVFV